MRAGRGVGLGAVLLAMIAVVGAASCRAGQPFAAVAPARAPTSAAANVATQVFNYDRFGAVTVYRGRGHPRDVVLFVSGDGGWDLGAASMAQRLADKGAMVAGIDGRHYRDQLEKASETCVSPSADFENLSHYLQSKWGLKKYLEPTLVGYATGATLVYATLAEAPEGLFKGALSIGFCPDLDLKKQLCKSPDLQSSPRLGSNGTLQGVDFSPGRELPGQWISLQGELDRVCPASSVRKFTATVRGSEMVMLPGVGHDYAIDEKWLPQFEAAYARLAAIRPEAEISALPAAVADLPLIIVPAATAGIGDRRDWFGVFLTGDGGWVGLDKGVSAVLAKHNIPIVGWDSLKYFWSRRTPDGASRDLERVLRTYSRVWGRAHVLLIGYSQGADTLPFMVNRLPAATRELVGFTTLLGISDNAVWEFHVASWLGNPSKGVPTAPELARWSGSPYLCLYGESDGDAACAQLTGHDGDALRMPGGHHFGGQYAEIADEILSRLPQQ